VRETTTMDDQIDINITETTPALINKTSDMKSITQNNSTNNIKGHNH
jgi:hypothetical protein